MNFTSCENCRVYVIWVLVSRHFPHDQRSYIQICPLIRLFSVNDQIQIFIRARKFLLDIYSCTFETKNFLNTVFSRVNEIGRCFRSNCSLRKKKSQLWSAEKSDLTGSRHFFLAARSYVNLTKLYGTSMN